MAPKFGTSGLRGLVTDLTAELVANYTNAFLEACEQGDAVYIGRDLRASSPDIANAVIDAVRNAGMKAIDVGVVPTPALALASMKAGCAAIMVTGSHIPADRNGLKFYVPTGEITKADEQAITAAFGSHSSTIENRGELEEDSSIGKRFIERYVAAFGSDALSGLTIGVYEHSSVARDILGETLRALGAKVVSIARSQIFIPVDTEAVDAEVRAQFAAWCEEYSLDALVSTDGDGDRPMLADSTGTVITGDVLGALTSRALGARVVCTPVSSNTNVDRMEDFDRVVRTRIGSPFVIAAMEEALTAEPKAAVVGYEANGGFLLGFEAQARQGVLAPLMTRDSVLPLIAPLAHAVARGKDVKSLVAELPPRFTTADRVTEIPTERSRAFIDDLINDPELRAEFFDAGADETELDLTDGLRVSFSNGFVVHLRPSGNAPECRCYAEADNPEAARGLVATHLERVREQLSPSPAL